MNMSHIYQVKIAVLIQSTQFDLQEQKFFIYSNTCNQIISICYYTSRSAVAGL